jgi:DNA repair photolyase
MSQSIPKGRGAQSQPPNRFEPIHREADWEHLEQGNEDPDETRSVRTQFFRDQSRSIVTENDSPDIGFRYSLNPYRGCEHGCPYCYARPTHEYLGLSAGLDFETTVFVKEQAPQLLREWLSKKSWQPEPICFSGVTDCYQPAERQFRLTRGCLEVALEARQPIMIVTKNRLVTRDLDLLAEMAARRIVQIAVSITTLDVALARSMEPRTSSPDARLSALSQLNEAGVPTRVMVAPVIPGLNDSEIPQILKAAKTAGALTASYVLLRLPLSVRPVFLEWLESRQPEQSERVQSRIRATRGGKWNQSQFGQRMRGIGPMAEQIRQAFEVFAHKHGLDGPLPPMDTTQFRPPRSNDGQLRLFD